MNAATTAAHNGHLHPIFQAALASFGAPSQVAQIQRAAYVKALKAHDWSHDFSDDADVARRGRESLALLRMVQREIDPEWAVWNVIAPACCRNGASYV